MSFRCQVCQEAQPSRSAPNTLITETRERVYPFREHANKPRVDGVRPNDPGGKGWEIVTEVKICDKCADQLETVEAA